MNNLYARGGLDERKHQDAVLVTTVVCAYVWNAGCCFFFLRNRCLGACTRICGRAHDEVQTTGTHPVGVWVAGLGRGFIREEEQLNC